jgi:hypothetical protein
MPHMMKSNYLASVLVITSAIAFATPARAESTAGESTGRYKIHIITVGQGDELFARFGHIGVVVDDREHRTRKVYNFGTFDFSDPDLQIRYARGFLMYWLSVSSYRGLVQSYEHDNREVVLRTLALSDAQAEEIARRLEINARPENRDYQYRHYLDNCCTRIRDLIDDVTGGAISRDRKKGATGRTFRDWTRRALEGMPLYSTVILYSLGPAIDRPISRWEEEFLPEVLSQDLDDVILADGHALVESSRVVMRRQGPAVGGSVSDIDIAVLGGIGLVLAFGLFVPLFARRRRVANRALGAGLTMYGLIAGLGGLMLVLYWTWTTHYDTHYNENLLLTPVTHLWLLGPGVKLLFKGDLGARTARFLELYLLASMAAVLVDIALKLGPFIQNNWNVVAFAALADAALYTALKRRRR